MSDTAGSGETPILNIIGTQVALGPFRRELVPQYLRWISDFGTMRNLGMAVRPMTLEAEQRWYDTMSSSSDESAFTIYERQTLSPIGTTGLHKIDYLHRRATFGIAIGEEVARGKGYGTETTRLILDYAFTALSLHSVNLVVYEYNHAGRRAYAKAGFRECGRHREAHLMGGRRWDIIHMDCLATEFTSPVLGRIFTPEPEREP